MTTPQASPTSSRPVLHVFEQDGGWHWGITVPRALGGGFKLIAFSEKTFTVESDAHDDGQQALVYLAGEGSRELVHQ